MKVLQTLLMSESVQALISSQETGIVEAATEFYEFPQKIKDHITANLESFVVPGDLKATHEKMIAFTENAVVGHLFELTSAIDN